MSTRTKVNYRKIWENHHQACIIKGMHIHHIDGDSHNNNPDNLMICTPEEHWNIHKEQGDIQCLNGRFIQGASEAGKIGGKSGVGWKYTEEQSQRLSEVLKESYIRRGGSPLKGKKLSSEQKTKIGNSVRGEKNGMFNRSHSEETRQKISENRKGIVGKPSGWKHNEETKSLIAKKRKDYFANGGQNSTSKLWNIYDENMNLLYTSMVKHDIMEQYSLNETQYKSLLAYMNRNQYTKPHPKMNILLKEVDND